MLEGSLEECRLVNCRNPLVRSFLTTLSIDPLLFLIHDCNFMKYVFSLHPPPQQLKKKKRKKEKSGWS